MRGLRYPALLRSVVVVIGLMLYFAEDFDAKSDRPSEILTAPEQAGIANETCLECHALPDQYYTLPSGEKLYLTIDEETYNHSVHGSGGYACVQCHTDLTGYPHPQLSATTLRDVRLSLYKSCARCHQEKYDASLDTVHQKALAAGNKEATIYTDCHGAHDTQPPDEPYSQTAEICERCHSQIYEVYQASV